MEKLLDCGYIFKVELAFSDGLELGYERENSYG